MSDAYPEPVFNGVPIAEAPPDYGDTFEGCPNDHMALYWPKSDVPESWCLTCQERVKGNLGRLYWLRPSLFGLPDGEGLLGVRTKYGAAIPHMVAANADPERAADMRATGHRLLARIGASQWPPLSHLNAEGDE